MIVMVFANGKLVQEQELLPDTEMDTFTFYLRPAPVEHYDDTEITIRLRKA